jgi:hypothetical protein
VAAVIGSLVGLLLGIVTPAVSATAMTSMAGSLLWLSGMRVLALRFEVPDGPWLPTSNVTWLMNCSMDIPWLGQHDCRYPGAKAKASATLQSDNREPASVQLK